MRPAAIPGVSLLISHLVRRDLFPVVVAVEFDGHDRLADGLHCSHVPQAIPAENGLAAIAHRPAPLKGGKGGLGKEWKKKVRKKSTQTEGEKQTGTQAKPILHTTFPENQTHHQRPQINISHERTLLGDGVVRFDLGALLLAGVEEPETPPCAAPAGRGLWVVNSRRTAPRTYRGTWHIGSAGRVRGLIAGGRARCRLALKVPTRRQRKGFVPRVPKSPKRRGNETKSARAFFCGRGFRLSSLPPALSPGRARPSGSRTGPRWPRHAPPTLPGAAFRILRRGRKEGGEREERVERRGQS